jgi:hypothetical protein
MREIVNLLLTALAAARLAWLISQEDGPGDVAANGRAWVVGRFGSDHWVTAGIHCPVCVSFWLALVLWLTPCPVRMWLAAAEVARQLVRSK